MREREAHADLGGEFGTVIAGAEQPDRRQRQVVRHRHHIVVGMAGREIAGLPQRQFMQPFEEIVALAAIEPAAQRVRGGAIGAGRAAEAEIDPAGKQRLQHLEALGHHQRRVVGQHHAAGADADVVRHRRDLPDHQVGRGARDRGQIVVLGKPVADIAEPIDMARQVDAVAQRRGRFGACGDDGEVEDGKRDHGAKLVRQMRGRQRPGRADQARAGGTSGMPDCDHEVGQIYDISTIISVCPPSMISRRYQLVQILY